jgi:hypothetical protein
VLAGELFVLFGLNVKEESFRKAYKHVVALMVVSRELTHALSSIGHGLVDMFEESAKAGNHLLGTAAAMGMSTKSVQEWSYIAKQAGSDVNQFVVGIGMFERNLLEFSKGRGPKRFKDAMAEVGLNAADAKRALSSKDGINEAIFRVSDAYVKMGDTAHRAAINTGLFGARARGMAQDLGQGSGALREKIEHLHQIGGVVDEEQLKNLKKADNAIDDLKTSFHALEMTVVAEVGPTFTALLNEVTAWIGENRELIDDVLGGAFKVLAFVFQALFAAVKALGWIIRGVMQGDTGAILLFSALAAMVVVAAIAIIQALIPAFVVLGVAIWTAMAPLLPFALAIAAVIAITIFLIKNWEKVKEWFHGWHAVILAVFAPWLAAIIAIAMAVEYIIDHWQGIKDWFSGLGGWVKDMWGKIVDGIVDKAYGLVNKLIHVLNYLPGIDIKDRVVPDRFKHGIPGQPITQDEIDDAVEKENARIEAKKKRDAAKAPKTSAYRGAGSDAGATAQAKPKIMPAAHSPHVSFGPVTSAADAHSSFGRPGKPLAANTSLSNTVNVAPTTVNIYGVKDAHEASGAIADHVDKTMRHAAGALAVESS